MRHGACSQDILKFGQEANIHKKGKGEWNTIVKWGRETAMTQDLGRRKKWPWAGLSREAFTAGSQVVADS